jgi:hypothetical protein
MDSDDQPTCGKGLAANAVLPEHLGQVTRAMANVLQAHVSALDLGDEHSRREYAAYENLIHELRQVADQLAATAQEMVGYRNLPMGRHDLAAMAQQVEPFRHYVQQKRNLLAVLQAMDDEDRAMLQAMDQR